jgi:hypothetical protein
MEKGERFMKNNKMLVSSTIAAIVLLVSMFAVAFAQSPFPGSGLWYPSSLTSPPAGYTATFGVANYMLCDGPGSVPPEPAHFYLGSDITVYYGAFNVVGLYGWDLNMTWNPSYLAFVSATDTGVGSTQAGLTATQHSFSYKNTTGDLVAAEAFLYGYGAKSFNGTGFCCAITFEVINSPTQLTAPPSWNWDNCSLTCISLTDLLQETWGVPPTISQYPEPPLYGPVNGLYSYGVGSIVPSAPTAVITYSPSYVTVGNNVSLSGSLSTTPSPSTITSYAWTITGGAGPIGPLTGVNTWFICKNTTAVSVSLTVTNSFTLTNTAVATITQHAVSAAILDIFTSPQRFDNVITTQTGKGLYAACDAIEPDENITLYGNVTWNGQGRANVLVTWEVIYEWEELYELPNGTAVLTPINATIAILTANTNESGIASVPFRMPTPYPTDETYPNFPLGKWLVIGKCEFQSIECMDTMRFDCGYMVNMPWMMTVNPLNPTMPVTSFQICDTIGIFIVYKNIGYMPVSLTIAATVYDVCEVPIGYATTTITAAGGTYCHPAVNYVLLTVHVPQWAYISPPTGNVYVSCLTALPRNCGIAFCPVLELTNPVNSLGVGLTLTI